MYFLPHLATISHYRHIRSNHGTDACLLSRIHNGTHQSNIFIINNGIDRKIALDAMFITDLCYLA